MNKKVIIQFLMISLIILISWILFSKYFKKDVPYKIQKTTIKEEVIFKNNNSNYIENIKYVSKDLRGNEYEIMAPQAEIDINNSDVMFLKDVTAYVYMKDLDTVKIISDFGKYNSKNQDTIFSKNVVVTYLDHKIIGEYLDFSLKNNLGTMSLNVFYTGEKMNLVADRIEMNLKTKDTKIFMDESDKEVFIKGIN